MKILIVQTGRIGDMILTTPMFRVVKEQFPAAELHVLTSAKGMPIIANNSCVDKILLREKGLAGLLAALLKVRMEHYDLWIDPKDHSSSESRLLARYSGAKKKIGFNKNEKPVFDISIPSDNENFSLHAVERNLRTFASLGYEDKKIVRPELFIDSQIESEVSKALLQSEKKLVVVNISAGQPTRAWNDEGWSSVIEWCFQKGFSVALSFQPSDAERAKNFQQKFPPLIVISSPTIHHAIALVKHALLVVTVDTSIVHIASAYNTPIVALYPNVDWNYNKFHPLSDKQAVIISSDSNSLKNISAEAVLVKIDEIVPNEN